MMTHQRIITAVTTEFCDDMDATDLTAILGEKISNSTLKNILNKNITDFTQGTPASSNDISRTAASPAAILPQHWSRLSAILRITRRLIWRVEEPLHLLPLCIHTYRCLNNS